MHVCACVSVRARVRVIFLVFGLQTRAHSKEKGAAADIDTTAAATAATFFLFSLAYKTRRKSAFACHSKAVCNRQPVDAHRRGCNTRYFTQHAQVVVGVSTSLRNFDLLLLATEAEVCVNAS